MDSHEMLCVGHFKPELNGRSQREGTGVIVQGFECEKKQDPPTKQCKRVAYYSCKTAQDMQPPHAVRVAEGQRHMPPANSVIKLDRHASNEVK